MLLGYKQDAVIRIGMKQGYITSLEAIKIWSNLIILKERMNGLVLQGYFESPKDDGKKIVWKYIK